MCRAICNCKGKAKRQPYKGPGLSGGIINTVKSCPGSRAARPSTLTDSEELNDWYEGDVLVIGHDHGPKELRYPQPSKFWTHNSHMIGQKSIRFTETASTVTPPLPSPIGSTSGVNVDIGVSAEGRVKVAGEKAPILRINGFRDNADQFPQKSPSTG